MPPLPLPERSSTNCAGARPNEWWLSWCEPGMCSHPVPPLMLQAVLLHHWASIDPIKPIFHCLGLIINASFTFSIHCLLFGLWVHTGATSHFTSSFYHLPHSAEATLGAAMLIQEGWEPSLNAAHCGVVSSSGQPPYTLPYWIAVFPVYLFCLFLCLRLIWSNNPILLNKNESGRDPDVKRCGLVYVYIVDIHICLLDRTWDFSVQNIWSTVKSVMRSPA